MRPPVSNIAWGDAVNGLRLGIAVEKNRYHLGETPIILNIFVANASTQQIKIVETHILREYDIELLINGTQSVRMTAAGEQALQAVMSGEIYRRIVVTIEPGTTYEVVQPVRLDEWFDLTEPGTYLVRVRRKDWQDERGPLTSGPATFTIEAGGDARRPA